MDKRSAISHASRALRRNAAAVCYWGVPVGRVGAHPWPIRLMNHPHARDEYKEGFADDRGRKCRRALYRGQLWNRGVSSTVARVYSVRAGPIADGSHEACAESASDARTGE